MFFRYIKALCLAILIVATLPQMAAAKWVEARSDNFVFVGDTSEKKAKQIVEELEEYRALIFKIFDVTPIPEILPVRIYAARSESQIKEMTGWDGAAGVYQMSREGPVFIMNIKGGFSRKSAARSTAYHEYTHHIISAYTNKIYPRWFNEGFAEYLSTFEFNNKKGQASVGLASDQRSVWLNSRNWLPMDVLLASVRRYPFKADGRGSEAVKAMFYAQSWLAAHHLSSHAEYNQKLQKYLAMLNDFDVPADAFEQAFGISPQDYEQILRAYFKKNRYAYSVVDMGAYAAPAVKTRVLGDAEINFSQAEAMRFFRQDDAGQALAQRYYDTALTKAGNNPALQAQIIASQALMLSLDQKNTEAAALLKPVIDALPDTKTEANSRLLTTMGLIYFNRYTSDQRSDDDMVTARRYLKRAIKTHPSNITAHYYYAASYPATVDKITKQAIYSAGDAALYYRDLQFTESNMALADILVRKNAGNGAVDMLHRARVWSQDSGVRRYATQMLRQIGELPDTPPTP